MKGSSPTVVVYPNSTADVVKIVNISRKYRMPIVPYSGATSLEGQYRAVSYQSQSASTPLLSINLSALGGGYLRGHVGHGQDTGNTR